MWWFLSSNLLWSSWSMKTQILLQSLKNLSNFIASFFDETLASMQIPYVCYSLASDVFFSQLLGHRNDKPHFWLCPRWELPYDHLSLCSSNKSFIEHENFNWLWQLTKRWSLNPRQSLWNQTKNLESFVPFELQLTIFFDFSLERFINFSKTWRRWNYYTWKRLYRGPRNSKEPINLQIFLKYWNYTFLKSNERLYQGGLSVIRSLLHQDLEQQKASFDKKFDAIEKGYRKKKEALERRERYVRHFVGGIGIIAAAVVAINIKKSLRVW